MTRRTWAGGDVSIAEMVQMVKDAVGSGGEIVPDAIRPDVISRKNIDSRRICAPGWTPQIALRDGISATYRWFSENVPQRSVAA